MRTWLRTLADHLADMRAAGRSGTDLHLHQLWRADGEPPHRHIHRQIIWLLGGLISIPLIGYGIYYGYSAGSFVPRRLHEWLGVAGVVVFYPCAIWFGSSAIPDNPPRLSLRGVRTRNGRRKLARRLVVGGVLGVVAALIAAFGGGVGTGLQVGLGFDVEFGFGSVTSYGFEFGSAGLVAGVVIGLALGLTETPNASNAEATHPSSLVRESLTWSIFTTVAVGSSVGLVGWLAGGIELGVTFGVFMGSACGFLLSPLPRYVLSVRRLHRAGLLPRRPGQFLDWAHRAGLIRMAGNAAQFRHRDLQTQLAGSSGSQQSASISP